MNKNHYLKAALYAAITNIIICLAVYAYAGSAKLEVTFTYDHPAKEFTLYLNGNKACSSPTGDVTAFTCDNVPVDYGVNMFTMTATELNDIETMHSPPFKWVYAPEVGAPPVFLNINVTVDGKNIHVKD